MCPGQAWPPAPAPPQPHPRSRTPAVRGPHPPTSIAARATAVPPPPAASLPVCPQPYNPPRPPSTSGNHALLDTIKVPRGNFAAIKTKLPPANYATDMLPPGPGGRLRGKPGAKGMGFGEWGEEGGCGGLACSAADVLGVQWVGAPHCQARHSVGGARVLPRRAPKPHASIAR